MMNMSSSSSCYSDLVVVVNKSRNRNRNKRHKLSSPSSSSSSKSYDNYCSFFTNRNQKHQHPTPPAAAATINNNSGFFEMSLLHKNDNMNGQQQKPSPEEDTTNSLFDVATTTLTTTVPLNGGGQKNVDDVWKEIVNTSTTSTSFCKQEVPDEMMTLEDFLAKAAAAAPASSDEHQDVKIPIIQTHSGPIFSFDHHPTTSVNINNKRRLLSEPLDRAAQQRQRRMIKNRESAARSRERKQAYQAELESLAVRLEEENQTLLKAKMDQTRKRYKQLMDSIIPVTEKRRPTSYVLRRVRSMEW
ncbi:G-box-binding factor 4-like [Rutidosis leptorrhynchoides]|uniref:G-box-binding factor 4-like n=1 Tax=Rutidosis leptorrhynchoides TaxID=125765 RepID=UPI003A999BCF